MTHTTFSKLIAVSALMGGLAFGSAAQAGSDDGLYSWSKSAGKSISSEMRYPEIAVRQGKEGATLFKVTVDRAGNVLDSDLTQRAKSGLINSAAKRALRNVDFPDLPASFEGDKLTFALRMNYALAYTPKEFRQLQREGRVSSTRIASGPAPMSASVEILDNEAE